MKIPSVTFRLASVEEDATWFVYFCFDNKQRWRDDILKMHPKLRERGKGIEDRELYMALCKEYVAELGREHASVLQSCVSEYQTEWNILNDDYFGILAEHFEVSYPEEHLNIEGRISVFPVFPRNLDTWTFNVGYQGVSQMKAIAMHELLHFAYFVKWKQVFPDMPRIEYDAPHLAWKLSEILDPIILSNHPKLQSLNPIPHRSYDSFEAAMVGDRRLMDMYTDLYLEHLATRGTFEYFLRNAWKVTQQNRSLIDRL